MGKCEELDKRVAKVLRMNRTERVRSRQVQSSVLSQSWVSIRQSMEQYQCCHAVTPTLLTMLPFCRLDSFPRAIIA